MKISVNSRNCRLSKESTDALKEQVECLLGSVGRVKSARVSVSKEGQSYLVELHLIGSGVDARGRGFGIEPETALSSAIDNAEGQLERAVGRQKRHDRHDQNLFQEIDDF